MLWCGAHGPSRNEFRKSDRRRVNGGTIRQGDIPMVNDQAFYDLRWAGGSVTTEREWNRICATISAIPADCHSILDVGTGNGLLANELAGTGKSVTAVDISEIALSKVTGRTLLRSADNLEGVADRSYDLVLCTEMLEHLDEATYRGALREFNRAVSYTHLRAHET